MDNSIISDSEFLIRHTGPGRVLYTKEDGTFYVGRNYSIYCSSDNGKSWIRVAIMPVSFLRRFAERSRLACRLLRHEVRTFTVLSDETYVAANREWVYYSTPGDILMRPSKIDLGLSSLMPPMCMVVGLNDRVLWGEYGGNKNRRQVHIFVSDDKGISFEVAYIFPTGTIRHVHNIVYDKKANRYWVLTGDFGNEAGMGVLSGDFKNFDWIVRGKQYYRTVNLFDFGEYLVYGTDTEKEPNAIMTLEKKTGYAHRLMELDGSCMYASRFGSLYALSTTVESSQTSLSKDAKLWVSRDGEHWINIFQATKDRWNGTYFQYGSLVLPRNSKSNREVILFSGQGLQGIDNAVMVGRLA